MFSIPRSQMRKARHYLESPITSNTSRANAERRTSGFLQTSVCPCTAVSLEPCLMLSLDGMECCIPDLDDASKYPDIITEMLVRGWSDDDIIGLMGANILRVLDEVDEVAAQLIGEEASAEIYEERTDLPALSVASWGPNLPDVVKEYVAKNAKR